MRLPGAAESKWRRINLLVKKHDLLLSATVRLLSQMTGNSIFKFIIYVRGGHCDYSSRAPKEDIATPLTTNTFCIGTQWRSDNLWPLLH
jgi:hypothetical protein